MSDKRRVRKTSRYSLVIHEVTDTSVNLWVGALSPSIAKPKNWCIVIKSVAQGFGVEDEVGSEVVRIEHLDDNVWKRPFADLNKRFYATETIDGLVPNQDYEVEFQVRYEGQWHEMETGFFSTLPQSLSNTPETAFTVGIGSCFYTKHDGGRAGQAWEALYKNDELRPDIKFLAGDQVYVDIGLGLFPLDDDDCQERIADDYAESWSLLRSMMRRGGTWMLPDDHEYWNNYPFLKGFNPYLITLEKSDSFRRRWEKACKMGVDAIQQVKTVRTFDIGNDLSFCVADLRSERTEDYFVEPANFAQIIDWVDGLNSPGVLVIPQPLIAGEGNDNDANLPDWDQYGELLKHIQNGNHDIVVLTGDVHYGRISTTYVGNSNNKLIEVITSPISNLSELHGIAADVPNLDDRAFPVVDVPGVNKNPIDYVDVVSTESEWWDLRFPVRRTKEHFMTVDFYRDGDGIKMKVNAWEAREIDRDTRLPKPIDGFKGLPITLK
jgi:hypothetical protein